MKNYNLFIYTPVTNPRTLLLTEPNYEDPIFINRTSNVTITQDAFDKNMENLFQETVFEFEIGDVLYETYSQAVP